MKKGENRVLWRMQGDKGATEMSEVMGGDEGKEMMRVHLHGHRHRRTHQSLLSMMRSSPNHRGPYLGSSFRPFFTTSRAAASLSSLSSSLNASKYMGPYLRGKEGIEREGERGRQGEK